MDLAWKEGQKAVVQALIRAGAETVTSHHELATYAVKKSRILFRNTLLHNTFERSGEVAQEQEKDWLGGWVRRNSEVRWDVGVGAY